MTFEEIATTLARNSVYLRTEFVLEVVHFCLHEILIRKSLDNVTQLQLRELPIQWSWRPDTHLCDVLHTLLVLANGADNEVDVESLGSAP